ncbi:MAG: hypothetical protein QM665_01015 [Desulfovibrio sp.]
MPRIDHMTCKNRMAHTPESFHFEIPVGGKAALPFTSQAFRGADKHFQ